MQNKLSFLTSPSTSKQIYNNNSSSLLSSPSAAKGKAERRRRGSWAALRARWTDSVARLRRGLVATVRGWTLGAGS